MTTLKAGDIRKKGDEVRACGFTEEYREQMMHAQAENLMRPEIQRQPESYFDGYMWRKTKLVGLEILPSDLMHLEFRRP
jgi:hypothetical protein